MQTLSSNWQEMQEYQKFLKENIDSGASPTTAVLKYHESQGGQFPGWLVRMSILGIASLGSWLGAIVFGIIGLFRVVRRGMAVAALVIAGLLTMYFCLSAISGAAG
jgi:uncharacterized membrane protein